ncbi:hypothetical protein EJ110_NYTH33455 [Nymphaea thermarum]|nr:hypothetical protein EJ110_NYTH33455 [Nymphaea thermarum]
MPCPDGILLDFHLNEFSQTSGNPESSSTSSAFSAQTWILTSPGVTLGLNESTVEDESDSEPREILIFERAEVSGLRQRDSCYTRFLKENTRSPALPATASPPGSIAEELSTEDDRSCLGAAGFLNASVEKDSAAGALTASVWSRELQDLLNTKDFGISSLVVFRWTSSSKTCVFNSPVEDYYDGGGCYGDYYEDRESSYEYQPRYEPDESHYLAEYHEHWHDRAYIAQENVEDSYYSEDECHRDEIDDSVEQWSEQAETHYSAGYSSQEDEVEGRLNGAQEAWPTSYDRQDDCYQSREEDVDEQSDDEQSDHDSVYSQENQSVESRGQEEDKHEDSDQDGEQQVDSEHSEQGSEGCQDEQEDDEVQQTYSEDSDQDGEQQVDSEHSEQGSECCQDEQEDDAVQQTDSENSDQNDRQQIDSEHSEQGYQQSDSKHYKQRSDCYQEEQDDDESSYNTISSDEASSEDGDDSGSDTSRQPREGHFREYPAVWGSCRYKLREDIRKLQSIASTGLRQPRGVTSVLNKGSPNPVRPAVRAEVQTTSPKVVPPSRVIRCTLQGNRRLTAETGQPIPQRSRSWTRPLSRSPLNSFLPAGYKLHEDIRKLQSIASTGLRQPRGVTSVLNKGSPNPVRPALILLDLLFGQKYRQPLLRCKRAWGPEHDCTATTSLEQMGNQDTFPMVTVQTLEDNKAAIIAQGSNLGRRKTFTRAMRIHLARRQRLIWVNLQLGLERPWMWPRAVIEGRARPSFTRGWCGRNCNGFKRASSPRNRGSFFLFLLLFSPLIHSPKVKEGDLLVLRREESLATVFPLQSFKNEQGATSGIPTNVRGQPVHWEGYPRLGNKECSIDILKNRQATSGDLRPPPATAATFPVTFPSQSPHHPAIHRGAPRRFRRGFTSSGRSLGDLHQPASLHNLGASLHHRGSTRTLLHLGNFTRQVDLGRVESKVILGVGTAIGVAFVAGARLDPTNLVSEPPWSQHHPWLSTMVKKKQVVAETPEVEEENSTHEEQPSTELEVQAVERMVHIENEVLQIRQEMSDYKRELSKLRELDEIKEMIRAMSSNQEANQRSTHGPPPPPQPRLEKGKGVLGGPPNTDPAPLHLQAGPRELVVIKEDIIVTMEGSILRRQTRRPASLMALKLASTGLDLGELSGRMIPQVRIDFPRFNGKDPLDWIFQVEEYYACQFVQEEEWLQTAVLHFDGEARRWYRWLKHNEHVADWEEFKDAILLRFGESAYVDHDIELRNLKQTSTVQEYQARFENLASMVEWTPKSLIAAFIGGLKEEIQIDIRAEKNEILRKCFAKARDIEERQRKKQALYKPWRNVPVARPRETHQQKLLPAPPRKEEPKPIYRSRAPPTHVSRRALKPHHGPVPEHEEPLPDVTPRPYRILKHRWVTRNGRPRHKVMIEWEGIDGGTSWELFDKIKLQFPTGAWGQAPSQEGGSDTGQPSTWPRAATDVAESSHRGRGKAALHSVQTKLSQDDPSPVKREEWEVKEGDLLVLRREESLATVFPLQSFKNEQGATSGIPTNVRGQPVHWEGYPRLGNKKECSIDILKNRQG